MTFQQVQQFVKKISEKFSEQEDIFDILARLTEECGEVASEVRKIEKKGSKRYFNIISRDKNELADELIDVLNVIASIANYYSMDLDKESARRNTHIKHALDIK